MSAPNAPPIFIDIESSGIARGSFPIEIGWARPVIMLDGRVELDVRSVLVRPSDNWLADPARWDSSAEPVHGLSREILLRDGRPLSDVCEMLDRTFDGAEVASDTGMGGWDDDWLLTLYEEAGRAGRNWDLAEKQSGGVVARQFRALGLDPRVVRPALAPWLPPHSHAAAEDALRFAWEWGMAEILARSDLVGRPDADLVAMLRDLPAVVPPARWPQAASHETYRRRASREAQSA
ncbi:hypothetical protein J5Y09_07210 [Roseomonas sp. PWR1]|uniref:Exonuclease domain-containing protein n=1 Tax=Roseomonas nitratireducens TaxID=2820810 RepID=A0ABS4AR27_9PROT|nr:hypothetical protein [Neoroseomonas nitratireducens]MBP0463694.1 hypothetical protein [Neoroseomonas nitratireducens]